jgi:hypothetical protein
MLVNIEEKGFWMLLWQIQRIKKIKKKEERKFFRLSKNN